MNPTSPSAADREEAAAWACSGSTALEMSVTRTLHESWITAYLAGVIAERGRGEKRFKDAIDLVDERNASIRQLCYEADELRIENASLRRVAEEANAAVNGPYSQMAWAALKDALRALDAAGKGEKG